MPATAFVEGLGDKVTYHQIEHENEVLTLAGLYNEWVNQETGEIKLSTSIITLPPVTGWEHIHPKSCPLILDYHNKALIDRWLDPEFHDVKEFDHLLAPTIWHDQVVTPIGKASTWDPIGDSFTIPGAPS